MFDDLNSHIQGRDFDVKEVGIVSVTTLHFVHKLSNELEHGWGQDVVRVNFPKLDVFLVERCSDFGGEALHDALRLGVSETL